MNGKGKAGNEDSRPELEGDLRGEVDDRRSLKRNNKPSWCLANLGKMQPDAKETKSLCSARRSGAQAWLSAHQLCRFDCDGLHQKPLGATALD